MSFAAHVDLEQRFLLSGVSWSTYQSLLQDLGDAHVRLTYDRGELELMAFIERRNTADETRWLAQFQDWVRANFSDQRRPQSS